MSSISKVTPRQCIPLQPLWGCNGTSRRSKATISLNFLFKKILNKNVLGKKNCLYKGFIKPSRSHQLLKLT